MLPASGMPCTCRFKILCLFPHLHCAALANCTFNLTMGGHGPVKFKCLNPNMEEYLFHFQNRSFKINFSCFMKVGYTQVFLGSVCILFCHFTLYVSNYMIHFPSNGMKAQSRNVESIKGDGEQ